MDLSDVVFVVEKDAYTTLYEMGDEYGVGAWLWQNSGFGAPYFRDPKHGVNAPGVIEAVWTVDGH